MRPLFLKLDDSLEYQGILGAAAEPWQGRVVEASDLGPLLRLWARPAELLVLEHRLRTKPPTGPELVFAGSTDFHHLTPILLRRALKAASAASATVVHLGAPIEERANGPQSRAWSKALTEHPGVVGLVSFNGRGDQPIASRNIYFTLDKAAFAGGDRAIEHLEAAVQTMARGRRVIGAEVFGDWSTPRFAGGRIATLIKHLTALTDLARSGDEVAARAADQAINLRILDIFSRLTLAEAPAPLARAH